MVDESDVRDVNTECTNAFKCRFWKNSLKLLFNARTTKMAKMTNLEFFISWKFYISILYISYIVYFQRLEFDF